MKLMTMPTGVGDVEVSKYRPPRYKLPVRLFGTDLEYGNLLLTIETDGPPDWMEGAPSAGIHHRVYSTDLVTVPEKGTLLVRFAHPGDQFGPTRELERTLEQGRTTCEHLREALSAAGWPDEVALPLGLAIVDAGQDEPTAPPRFGCDPAIVTQLDDWRGLPGRLRKIADHHASKLREATGERSRLLADAIKSLDERGHDYFDHLHCVQNLGVTTPQLLGKQSAA